MQDKIMIDILTIQTVIFFLSIIKIRIEINTELNSRFITLIESNLIITLIEWVIFIQCSKG